MLKYKYIFQIKYTQAISSNSTRKLLWFEITEMVIAVKNKFVVLFSIFFGTLSFPVLTRQRGNSALQTAPTALLARPTGLVSAPSSRMQPIQRSRGVILRTSRQGRHSLQWYRHASISFVMCKYDRHPQNRKYITHSNTAKGGLSLSEPRPLAAWCR